jgi:YVTN family beta-propeller protein
MSIGAGVAFGTPGSIPFIDASGALQQDNANLKWDENLKRLTLSQGLTIGSVDVVNTVNVGSNPRSTTISGNYAYVANSFSGSISIIDITNPTSASVVATVNVGSGPREPVISGNYAYVINAGSGTISIIDITNPLSASVVNTLNIGINTRSITISGNYAYVVAGSDVGIIDITNPLSASVVNIVSVGSNPLSLTISGNYAYVANTNSNNVSIIDITNPLSASVVNTIPVGVRPGYITTSGNYAYVSNEDSNNVSIIVITNPVSASVVATVPVGSTPQTPAISGNYAYVSNEDSNNVSIIDITDVANVLPPSSVVVLSVDGTIQSTILSGSGVINLTADNNGNIIPTFSDQSLKINVSNISSALSKIKFLQGKYYNWKDTDRFGAQTEIGFIAQEVEPYVPEVVRTVGSFKTLNYGNLVALHNEGIKELDLRLATIESLAGLDETSATQSLFARFADFLKSTTAKVIGGVVRFTDRTIHKELCIGEGSNITCITKTQLDQILSQAGVNPSDTSSESESLDDSSQGSDADESLDESENDHSNSEPSQDTDTSEDESEPTLPESPNTSEDENESQDPQINETPDQGIINQEEDELDGEEE